MGKPIPNKLGTAILASCVALPLVGLLVEPCGFSSHIVRSNEKGPFGPFHVLVGRRESNIYVFRRITPSLILYYPHCYPHDHDPDKACLRRQGAKPLDP